MVKLTPDGRAWEASSEQADDERITRVYSGTALGSQTLHTDHDMLDTLAAADKPNRMATIIYRNMRSGAYMPEDTICGTVYITTETANETVDVTMHDFMYMYNQIFKPINTN